VRVQLRRRVAELNGALWNLSLKSRLARLAAVLWLSGRYNGVVYAISTKNGRLLARIVVGAGPHGLCVWPQPGRYSLGHTGILR